MVPSSTRARLRRRQGLAATPRRRQRRIELPELRLTQASDRLGLVDGRRRAVQATVPEAVEDDQVDQVHHAEDDDDGAELPAEVLGDGEAARRRGARREEE